MPDFRVDDSVAEHRKHRRAGLAAIGLWTTAGAWCMNPAHLTDGRVPAHYVAGWPGGKKAAMKLVEADLWHAPGHACPDCPQPEPGWWVFHDWPGYQRLAEALAKEKEASRERVAKWRAGNSARNGVTNGVRTGERTEHVPGTNDERAAYVRTPPSPSPKDGGGSLGGVTNPREGARDGTNTPPPTPSDQPKQRRCITHRHLPDDEDPGPCRGCKQARERQERYEREAIGAVRDAIRACGLCDAEGRRKATLGVPGTPPCDHRPSDAERTPADSRGDFDGLRAAALAVDCPTCPAGPGEPCEGVDRAPAHHTRITAARKVPA